MLGKYITINNTQMPNPTSYEETLNPSENVYESEAGTQMSNIVRLDRFSFSASWNCTSRLRDTLKTYCKTASVNVSVDGVAYTGRMRLGGAISLVENSETNTGTQGLWTVPITFEGE